MKKVNILLNTMSSYLTKYITVTKGLSENSIRSYKHTFQLLFTFLKEEMGIPPEKVRFEALDRNMMEQFLLWLEEKRSCSISTRNQRLSGIASFAKYAMSREPVEAVGFYNAISEIPKKKADEIIPIHFTKEEVSIMLHLPSGKENIAFRDRTLLSALYATGARAQELCDICVRDIHFGDKTSIKLVGKGRKARVITIPDTCANLIKNYLITVNKFDSLNSHAFSSQTHEHMTISCVEEIVKKYLKVAKSKHPALFREKKYTPHSFRHSIAVHMLEAGIPLPVIKNFLGHSSIEVTMIYATVSDDLKNKYLKENSLARLLPGNDENKAIKTTYSGLDFLNKI